MRQLAAIMFSDMAGYTALMQQNEQLARESRQRLKDVLETQVPLHHGRILEYVGDGALSIFNSAVDAARCATEIQLALLQPPIVSLRIGIHTGDIAIEDDGIYGDGVNLAARIESLAVPGSVLISEKVYDEISNQSHMPAREIGFFEFKHVIKPIRIFALANEGLIVPARNELKGKTSMTGNRLAVLPFVNMSADPDNEYFADGITEELLNALTRVKGLQVTARTSAFAFKGLQKDIREIGVQLNVDRIMEGSVRKSGNRVRITAQLINAADGYHIWSENYNRDLNDIFAVQDEISNIIANKLRENLAIKAHDEVLVKAPTQNMEAYNLYLKGLHFYHKITPADAKRAITCFEEAISLAPDFANAYAMAAATYAFLGSSGQMLPKNAFAIVHKYADKALQLDRELAVGYAVKGSAYLLYDWKWKEAYEALQKAIQLNPGSTDAHQMLAYYYMITGQREKAVEIMEQANRVDPMSPIVTKTLADAYNNAGKFEDAFRQSTLMLEFYPHMPIAHELHGWSTGMSGDWKKAAAIFEENHRAFVKHPLKGLFPMGCAYAQAGEIEKAMKCIRLIEQRQAEEPGLVLDADLAMIWLSMGKLDKGFHHLFKCVDKRMGPVAMIINHPMFKVPVDDPRYRELQEQMGLTKA
jgi:adenylate cyclase